MPKTTNGLDYTVSQQKGEKYPQVDSIPKTIRGILIGLSIAFSLWCLIATGGIVISLLSNYLS